jgi:hypothetical protein
MSIWGCGSPAHCCQLAVAGGFIYADLRSELLLIFQFFSFFPGWGSVCPGGYADLAQGCLWEYRMPLSSHCGPRLPKPSGCWCLAAVREASWFLRLTWSGDAMRRLDVWRSQKFCLVSVVFPVRCISSVSPRFYFRKHTFCFLPLANILESLINF